MLASFLALAMTQTLVLKAQEKGSYLYHACKAEIRVIDSADGRGEASDQFLAHTCFEYVSGFVEGTDFAGDKVCPTPGLSIGTMIRVYVTYMDKNPTMMDLAKGATLYMAIHDSYGCPAK